MFLITTPRVMRTNLYQRLAITHVFPPIIYLERLQAFIGKGKKSLKRLETENFRTYKSVQDG